jgi:hypothetical protein
MDLVRPNARYEDRATTDATRSGERDRSGGARSSYGEVPGAELPGAIYRLIVAAYAWMLLAAWVAFGSGAESDLNLSIAVVLAVVFFALPIIMRRSAITRLHAGRQTLDQFLSRQVETATGPLPAREVLLQVLLIPIALAVAATMIGAVYIVVG